MKSTTDFLNNDEKTLVEWDRRYEFGIPVIDEQHKELINLTNKLYKACLAGDEAARSSFKEAIRSVVEYVKFHFSAEEKILEKINYPNLCEHKKQHEILVKDVLDSVRLFEEGKKFVPNTFVRTLKDWIMTHIAVSDREYSEYLINLKKQGKLNIALAKQKGLA